MEMVWTDMCREAQTVSMAQQTMPWTRATRHRTSMGVGQVRGEAVLRLMVLLRTGRTAGLRKVFTTSQILDVRIVSALGCRGGEDVLRLNTCAMYMMY